MLWFASSSATRWPTCPGIYLKLRELCVAVVTGDFLRYGTRAQQNESCYCDGFGFAFGFYSAS